ncbi:MAG: hypothetical protein Q7R67_02050 [bacterium]|nr:hypothetical protein [bacterium]
MLPPSMPPEQLAHYMANMSYWTLAIYMTIVFGVPTLMWLNHKFRKHPISSR